MKGRRDERKAFMRLIFDFFGGKNVDSKKDNTQFAQ